MSVSRKSRPPFRALALRFPTRLWACSLWACSLWACSLSACGDPAALPDTMCICMACPEGQVWDCWVDRCTATPGRGVCSDSGRADAEVDARPEASVDVELLDAPVDVPADVPADVFMDVVVDAPDDVVVPLGPTGCTDHLMTPGTLLCDAFEGGSIEPIWTREAGTNFTPMARRGDAAILMDATDAVGTPRFLRWSGSPIGLGETVYFHAWVRIDIPDSMMGPNDAISLVQVSGAEGRRSSVVVLGDGDSAILVEGRPFAAGARWTRGEWFCLRAEFELARGTGGSVRAFDGDNEVVSYLDTDTGDGSATIAVGPVFVNNDARAAIRMDDVAISSTPLPCLVE